MPLNSRASKHSIRKEYDSNLSVPVPPIRSKRSIGGFERTEVIQKLTAPFGPRDSSLPTSPGYIPLNRPTLSAANRLTRPTRASQARADESQAQIQERQHSSISGGDKVPHKPSPLGQSGNPVSSRKSSVNASSSTASVFNVARVLRGRVSGILRKSLKQSASEPVLKDQGDIPSVNMDSQRRVPTRTSSSKHGTNGAHKHGDDVKSKIERGDGNIRRRVSYQDIAPRANQHSSLASTKQVEREAAGGMEGNIRRRPVGQNIAQRTDHGSSLANTFQGEHRTPGRVEGKVRQRESVQDIAHQANVHKDQGSSLAPNTRQAEDGPAGGDGEELSTPPISHENRSRISNEEVHQSGNAENGFGMGLDQLLREAETHYRKVVEIAEGTQDPEARKAIKLVLEPIASAIVATRSACISVLALENAIHRLANYTVVAVATASSVADVAKTHKVPKPEGSHRGHN